MSTRACLYDKNRYIDDLIGSSKHPEDRHLRCGHWTTCRWPSRS